MGKNTITMETVLLRREDIPTTDLDGEIGMMNIDTGKYYSLDNVSARIWELLEAPLSAKDVVSKLMDEYEVDEATCTSQVMSFLEKLSEEKLVIQK